MKKDTAELTEQQMRELQELIDNGYEETLMAFADVATDAFAEGFITGFKREVAKGVVYGAVTALAAIAIAEGVKWLKRKKQKTDE